MTPPADPARWSEIKRLFDAAVDLPPGDRATFLDRACRTSQGAVDTDLRDAVRALLRADAEAEAESDTNSGFLDAAPLTVLLDSLSGGEAETAKAAPPGTRVGPYRVVRLLGRGGMGEVYLAERADGLFERTVALKRVRADLAPTVAARFEAERNILAGLVHPGIARLYAAGFEDDGRPWLAMEPVDGVPLPTFAADRSLTERVELLRQACAAVHHAHQQLVVHRDLKPSNILVTAEGRVQLLDFGIAQVLGTEEGRRFLTRAYATPEQLRGEPATTATDVYGLGLLLFESLTAARPFPGDDPERSAPPLASERTQPADGGIEPRLLRGDLDAICRKALAPAPADRYASAEALSADLGRALADQPVEARPPSAAYRSRQFVRRHRAGVATAAVALVALVAGGAFYTARVTAERNRAQAEADKAAQVSAFMGGLFRDADPAQTGGTRVSAREVLDRAVARLADDTLQAPAVRAALHQALGEVYASLALTSEARRRLDAADSLRARRLGPRHPDRADGWLALAALALDTGDYRGADSLARAAVALRRETGASRPALALAEARLGAVEVARGQYSEAESRLRHALAVLDADGRADEADRVRLTLASAVQELDRLDEAETLLREAHRGLAARRGGRHPDSRAAEAALADLLLDAGRLDDARRLHVAALATARRLYGDDHPVTAEALRRVGAVLTEASDYAAAADTLDRALAILRAATDGPTLPLARHLLSRATVDLYLQNYAAGETRLDSALRIALATVGEQHPVTLSALNDRAYARSYTDDLDGAEADYRRVLAGERALRGEVHSEVAEALASLSTLLWTRERPDEAIETAREGLTMRRRLLRAGHPDLSNSLYSLGSMLLYAERPAEAEAPIAEAAAIRRATFGADDWRTIQADGRLAHIRALLDTPGAGDALRDVLRRADAALAPGGESQWVTDQVVGSLADYHEARGEADAAARYRARLPAE